MAEADDLLAQGLEHYRAGRIAEAAESWRAVLKIEPENPRAREYLRRALIPQPAASAPVSEAAAATAWDDAPAVAPPVVMDDGRDPVELEEEEAFRRARHETDPGELVVVARQARERYALNDFSGALTLIEPLLKRDPNQPTLTSIRDSCVATLTAMYESHLGPLAGIPAVVAPPDEIIWLDLDHRAGFVLAQIDGRVSYEDLYAICGMSRLDTAKILAQLLTKRVIVTAR